TERIEGGVAPAGTTAVGHEARKVREILRHVVKGHWVAELRAGSGEDRGPRVNCDGHPDSFGCLVDGPKRGHLSVRVGVRGEELMGWMDLHPAHFPFRFEALDIALRIL